MLPWSSIDNNQRIPKQLLYGESEIGKRKVGRPKLRYTDQIKSDMKKLNIDTNSWERFSSDRAMWRTMIRNGLIS